MKILRQPFSRCHANKHLHHKFVRYGKAKKFVKLEAPRDDDFCIYCNRSRKSVNIEIAELQLRREEASRL